MTRLKRKRSPRYAVRRRAVERLEPRFLLAGEIVISEFMARNGHGLHDQDGDAADWLEIFNNDAQTVDLSGWHLSHNSQQLAEWTFPAGATLEPGGLLLVFASGKDRAVAGNELHTNFTLEDTGGFLALVNSNNQVQHSYDAYPPQLMDVAYGIEMPPEPEPDLVTLVPEYDTWLRESDPNRSYENDAMWVASRSVFGENRWGVAQWDLSGIDDAIVGAHLEFNPRSRADGDATQQAFTIAPGLAGLTYNGYLATKAATESPLESFGGITLPAGGAPLGAYIAGDQATANDLTVLNSLRTATGSLTLAFKGTNNAMEWNDGANVGGPGYQGDLPIRLVIDAGGDYQPVTLQLDQLNFFTLATPNAFNVGGSDNLTEGVFITEFVTINDGAVRDEDGDSSDWIEIYNATPAAVDIGGWHLTDDPLVLDQWTFPTGTSLASGEFLIVFASEKDRAIANQELHANFRLTSNSNYLALTDDGLTIRNEYTFPEQFADVAYGLAFGQLPPTPTIEHDAGELYRADFDDESALARYSGVESLAGAASFRFNDVNGSWSNPAAPHHVGGQGGIAHFSRTINDSTGGNPITWTHLDGDAVRANREGIPDDVHGDFWFFAKTSYVDWQLSGLIPGAEYELFHYGGWAPDSPDDERIAIVIDTDGDGTVETSQTAGLISGGPDGAHFPSIIADAQGQIAGRWEGVPATPSWADTAGFQLALVTGVEPPNPQGIPLDTSAVGYLRTPTPLAANANEVVLGFVRDTMFNTDRGFFEAGETVDLIISTETPGARIYYTLDGSEPSPDNLSARLFDPLSPLLIDSTSAVRAAAFKDGFQPTNVDTQTYIFLNDVLLQSPGGQAPAGWPSGNIGGQVLDYGMDPEIVNDPVWGPQLVDALKSISSISLVTDLDNLFDPSSGIYVNAGGQGFAWERPTSVELLNPDGTPGFQIDAGVRPRGNFSASGSNPKHAFRLFFRDEYGDPQLEYPLFGDEGVDVFRKLDLRASQNDSWPFQASDELTFIHDVFARDLQREMGQPYTRSRYYHLYINGVYWGLFQSQERSEANYGESYFGGRESDYDVIKATGGSQYQMEATDGNTDAWFDLWTQARNIAVNPSHENYMRVQGLNPDGSRNLDYPVLLDVDNLIDYMIGIFYTGDEDRGLSRPLANNRPNNFFAVRNRNGEQGFAFFAQDAEQSLESRHNVDGLLTNRVGPFSGSNQNNFTYSNPQWIHQDLSANESYRQRFADRVHEYFFNDGLLTPDNVIAAFQRRADEIELAVIAESARWGDAHPSRANNPLDKNDWLAALRNLYDNYFPQRGQVVLDQLRAAGLYPQTPAPEFNQQGGEVPVGFSLEIDVADSLTFVDTTLLYSGANAIAAVPLDDSWDTAPVGQRWNDVGFISDPSVVPGGWIAGATGVGYENSPGGQVDYSGLLGLDVGEALATAGNTSVYVRVEFDLDSILGQAYDARDFDRLLLRMKYDDAFVAYINGVEVSRSFFDGAPAWNSSASGEHGDAQAIEFQEFDISQQLHLLAPGRNLLAIHGLNINTNSSDLLIAPELVLSAVDEVTRPLIYYTIDGQTDPRAEDGSPAGALYTGPIAITEHQFLQARAFLQGTWSALNAAQFVVTGVGAPKAAAPGDLVISEINYNPSDPSQTELALMPNLDSDAFEFLEVLNIADTEVSLIGVVFQGDPIQFQFGVQGQLTTLQPGERAVVVRDRAAFQLRYGDQIPIAGEFTSGQLSNAGEAIALLNVTGAPLVSFAYDDELPWPLTPDGLGFTLVLKDPHSNPDPRNPFLWRASGIAAGSPGAEDVATSATILVNEALTHTDPPQVDAIELLNPTLQAVDVSGWFLSDDATSLMKYVIPPGSVIAAGETLVLREDDDADPLTAPPSGYFGGAFSLSSTGDELVLSSGDGASLTGYTHGYSFGAAENGRSFIRHVDSTGREHFAAQDGIPGETLGAANVSFLVGQVIISELHYNPYPADPDEPFVDEFVEIYNTTDEDVSLFDPSNPDNRWVIDGLSGFMFPDGATLAAGGMGLVVPIAPDQFRAKYSIDPSVVIFGPFLGGLSDSGERIALQRPDAPDVELVPLIDVDVVGYEDRLPWPVQADGVNGDGSSLNRQSISSFGGDPASWAPWEPSPGVVPFGPPRVLQVGINENDVDPPDLPSAPSSTNWLRQRGDLSSLTVTFNKTVLVSPQDLVLTNLGVQAPVDDDVAIDLADAQLDVRGNTLILTLPRQLPDGVYSLEILSTVVDLDGAALDGNADGTGGDAFAFSGNVQNRFYQLTGDWNGDGGVSIFDFPTFSYWFGQSVPTAPEYVDINGDQGISIFDFGGFAARFGSSIAYAEAPLARPALIPSIVERSVWRQRSPALERPVANARLALAPTLAGQPTNALDRPANDLRRHPIRRLHEREWVELEESLDDFVPGLMRQIISRVPKSLAENALRCPNEAPSG